MRVFIIGSFKDLINISSEQFSDYCYKLGKELAKYPIELVLCSPYEDSSDKQVFNGIIESDIVKLQINVICPNDENTPNKWETLFKANANIKHFIEKLGYDETIENNQQFSWLYTQIQALSACDIVFVIGGRLEGSANLLLRIAEAEDKNVIPLYQLGGLAEHYFRRNYYKLLDTWGEDDLNLFGENEKISIIVKTVLDSPIPRKKKLIKNPDPIFFLSYSRARPQEADFVEMQLRRRGFTVIRDDHDINESVDITNAIQESINKADVFIALWSKEYACSPWCFDEMTTAVNKKQKDKYTIWLLCLDDTRIVHPRARNLLHFKVKTREEIEGRISLLLEKYRK